jgi:hypothetical protein
VDYRVLANTFVSEGALAGTPFSPTLPWRPRRIIFTNDSTLNTLTIRINNQSTFSIKPLETLTASMNVYSVILDGTGNYRFWAFG